MQKSSGNRCFYSAAAALEYDSLIGSLVAHESNRLVLLSLDPDTIHRLSLHEPHKTAIIQSCITASSNIIY